MFTLVRENRGMNSPILGTTPQTLKGRKESRVNYRYPVKTPLRYRTLGGAQGSLWMSGRTTEMSASGLLMQVQEGIAIDTILELSMDWPGLYHDKPAVRLFVIGAVTRVDSRGTVVRILSHQFRDLRGGEVQRSESQMTMPQ